LELQKAIIGHQRHRKKEKNNTKGNTMDINQNINTKKIAKDLSQFALKNHLPGKGESASKGMVKEIFTPPFGSTTVNLSKEGRAASFTVDFNAAADNFSKLNVLKNSDSFAKAHSSISYEKVKNLLD
jgi:hypothetical protein